MTSYSLHFKDEKKLKNIFLSTTTIWFDDTFIVSVHVHDSQTYLWSGHFYLRVDNHSFTPAHCFFCAADTMLSGAILTAAAT